jgi:cyclohexanone monooxygenase/phenylacetone monooxygenase
MVSIEQHVEWIRDLITQMRERDLHRADVLFDAEERWVAEVADLAAQTLFPLAKSWYLGDNVEGKPRTFLVYLGGVGRYRDICDDVAANNYRGFVLS